MTLALSIRQPWAWAIFNGNPVKDVENRSWPTKVRGRILIHAGLKMTADDWNGCMDLLDQINPVGWAFRQGRRASALHSEEARRGGIIGSAEIVDCVSASSSPWFFGQYGFLLRNSQPLPFRPLGFFEVDE